MRTMTTRTALVTATAALGALALAGCTAAEPPASSSAPTEIGSVDLSAACPSTIVVQTEWNPQSEFGFLYNLLGSDYTLDNAKKAVTGALMDAGEYTGVDIEIRIGGAAVAYQTVPAAMYTDDTITFGLVGGDRAVELSNQFEVTGVFTPFVKTGSAIMWDPETYPDITSIEELRDALEENDGVVIYAQPSTYMEYLLSTGILTEDVIDGSFDGSPATFVASGGRDAQQAFATNEPYAYEHEVSSWAKPTAFQLMADVGWNPATSVFSVRSSEVEAHSECLTGLVPVLQRSAADYLADPSYANEIIVSAVEDYNTGFVYSREVADYAAETMRVEGIQGNGADGHIGAVDLANMDRFIELAAPIFEEAGTPIREGLTAEQLYTTEFIDPSISAD